jgi:hypothetical protein
MLRWGLIILTTSVCVGAGATASLAAFATVLNWPLSEINFRDSVCFGAGWGVVGAVVSLLALLFADRKQLCLIAKEIFCGDSDGPQDTHDLGLRSALAQEAQDVCRLLLAAELPRETKEATCRC